ncbi:MAG: N-acetylmuramoyl-L-alanine amidase [Acidobacteria bacterium]|nr:N-acetylmuramoyl-L-alanine amidase [Acidobacteriota bacterium]
MTSDPAETERLYGHPIDVSWLLDKSTMSSTVASFYQIDVGSFFNTIVPTGIIVHHSVLTPAGNVPETEEAIDRFHSARGYEVSCFGKVYHIAYHYLILPNGKVVSGRPERCEGAHARGYNSYLGIALVGNFSSGTKSGQPARPTQAQLKSLVRLCCYLRQKYHIPLQHIMPHNRVARTECPGDGLKFDTVLAAISSESGAGS